MVKFSNADTIVKEVVRCTAVQMLYNGVKPSDIVRYISKEFHVDIQKTETIRYWHTKYSRPIHCEDLPAVLAGVMNFCQDIIDLRRKPSDRKTPIEMEVFMVPMIQRLSELGLGCYKIHKIFKELDINIPIKTINKWVHADYDARAVINIDGDCVWTVGTICTDGYCKFLRGKWKNENILKLVSADLAYVQEFSERAARVLNRPRPNAVIPEKGNYFSCVYRSRAFRAIFGGRQHILSKLDTFHPIIAAHSEHFIGALISGDGSIDIGECEIRVFNTNKKLLMIAKQILADEVGVKVNEPAPYAKTKSGRIAYRLRIGTRAACEIYDEIAPHVMQRRRVLWKTAILLRDLYRYRERREIRKKYSRSLNKLLTPLPKIDHIEDHISREFAKNPEKFFHPSSFFSPIFIFGLFHVHFEVLFHVWIDLASF